MGMNEDRQGLSLPVSIERSVRVWVVFLTFSVGGKEMLYFQTQKEFLLFNRFDAQKSNLILN